LIVTAKEVLTPAAGLDGETDTAKKHLLVEEQVDVCPAAGAASIATPSMLAASTNNEIRVTVKPAFGMVNPLSCINRAARARQQDPALPETRSAFAPIH
jgi:hypothetical protein